MRIIVSGGREYKNHQHIYAVLNTVVRPSDIIVQGGAPGVDRVAATWARTHGVACREYPAQWNQFGTAAGRMRNMAMAKEADALVAFWNGESPGTSNMIRQMQIAKKPIFVAYYDENGPVQGLNHA